MDDMVIPLIVLPEPEYCGPTITEVYNDYFGQRIRGSEIISSDVQ